MKSLIVIFVLGLNACSRPDHSFDRKKIAAEASDRFESFVQAMNNRSVEDLSTFYSDDSRFYWVEDGLIQYPNKKALLASLNGLVQSLNSTNLQILKTNTEVLSKESVMLFAEYEQAAELKSGVSFNIKGATTILLVKEQGVWRFLIGHSSSKKQRRG